MIYKRKKMIFSATAAMADLALLLVVFFVASSSIQDHKILSVDLPTAIVDQSDAESLLYLSISKEGIILFQNVEYTIETLEIALSTFSFLPTQYIALVADKDISYALVSDVFKILEERDVSNIIFVSTPKE